MQISDKNLARHDMRFGGEQILDVRTLEALLDLGGEEDPGLLLELVDLFVEDASERMGRIMAAIEEGNMDVVGLEAHALKSSSANLGAMPFSGRCLELESEARAHEMDVPVMVAETRDMYHELQSELARLKSSLQG